ncbi:MAG: DUF1801 domain-containing protein [Leptospiraceae bacterium]|nr:DUF1801 domain-containing protein [Leptospiraceae bacterium]
MNTKFKTIDEYIASFPNNVQKILEKIRATIKKIIPKAEETISYAIPTFQLNGKSLVHFAGFKNHIGFYATPTGHKEFKKELANYKQGKGSVQFPLDQPIPYDLIKRIVKFRVEELTNKTKVTSKSTKQEGSLDQYLLNLKHPLKKEIEYLRKVILEANKGLTENIKWNAPNFCYEGQDRITMRIHPPTQIQLIFHRGAKTQKLPSENLISDDKGLLVWKTTDRAVASFKDQNDIKTKSKNLKIIINNWIKAGK